MFLAPRGAHADPLVLVPALIKAKVTRITLTPSLLASMLRTSDADPLLPDLHVRPLALRTANVWRYMCKVAQIS